MTSGCPFDQATAPDHRANPYPFYAELPAGPVRLEDGRYVVSGYDEVVSLLHDPRLSSAAARASEAHPDPERGLSLLRLDPPDHDKLRRIMMRQFGPPHRPRMIADLEGEITRVTQGLIDDLAGMRQADLVNNFAHKLPIAIICKLFGIPVSDETRFHGWVRAITAGAGEAKQSPEAQEALAKLGTYLAEIAASRRGGDGEDFLSGFVNDEGPEGKLPEKSIAPMAALVLIAGHETTVNLIGNGILTLLRHPDEIAALRREPERAIGLVEELLRYEPPVQFIRRTTLADVTVRDVTIPEGSTVMLVLAAANRDDRQFPRATTFDPGRDDNQHLGFGSGIHACFGAPLARLEGQIALRLIFERLENPSLAGEPPYRESPLLRGPSELTVAYEGVRPVKSIDHAGDDRR